MKKVFTDNLPSKIGFGVNTSKKIVDWEKTIGYSIYFEYDSIKSSFQVISYQKNKHELIIDYEFNKYSIKTSNLIYCKISKILNVKRPVVYSAYKYNIGDIIENDFGKIIITHQIRISNGNTTGKGYKYKCLIDNYIGEIFETNISRGHGCRVCSNNVVLVGINDIWATNPELSKLLANSGDVHKYTQNSNKKVDWICPECGLLIEQRQISQINKQGLSCPRCSTGISYPNRLMFNILKQTKIYFRNEECPLWNNGENKIYDFYIPSLSCIIEMNGNQHYSKNGFVSQDGRSLENEQNNDKLKEQIAKKNGIINYIVIDARHSKLNFIKKNILNSSLIDILNLSEIDWELANTLSQNSLIKDVCNLWSNGIKSTTKIGLLLGVCRNTVTFYLKRGVECGFCNYNPKQSMKEHLYTKGCESLNKRKVYCVTTNEVFNSIKEANKKYNSKNISTCCSCSSCHYSGINPITGEPLVWMYYEEYIKTK